MSPLSVRCSTTLLATVCAFALTSACNSDSANGIDQCVQACETLLTTNCESNATAFCQDAQTQCKARYDENDDCLAELKAMDACAAAEAANNFVCPLGLQTDEVRPYLLSEDSCVQVARALAECM